MKRIVIGGFIMLGGLLTTLTIIMAAAIYVPSITQWSGQSKLWFAIFGAKQYGNEVVQSLFLGFPFVIGVSLTIVGIIILGCEYFKTINNLQIGNLGKQQETIEFTYEIKKKLNELKIDRKISVVEKSFIINNYLTDEKINEVYPTPFKNYFLVDVNGEAHLVVIKNNLALRVTEPHLNGQLELKNWYATISQSILFD
jgi:hypothetical protein